MYGHGRRRVNQSADTPATWAANPASRNAPGATRRIYDEGAPHRDAPSVHRTTVSRPYAVTGSDLAQIAQVGVGEVGAAEVLLAALIVQEIVRVEVVAELQVAEVDA